MASCGDDGQYLKTIHVYADERPEGCGPTGIAVREARTYVCNDFFADPCTLPWRATAAQHGFRASIALPFCQGGQIVGALTAYASECNVFGEKEITLFNEAAAAITLALDKFEHEWQRAQAEARQRASDERLRAAFNSKLIAYSIIECDGRRMLDVNTRMAELFGYTREEMIGHTSAGLGLYENLEERQRLNYTLDEGEVLENYEVVARRKTGERFYVALSAIELQATEPPLILAILIDITARKEVERELEQHRQHLEDMVADRTERLVVANQQLCAEIAERKHAEELLRASEEQYRCIVETAQEGIYMYDTDWRFVFVNQQLADLLGYTREEMVGQSIDAFIFEYDRHTHAERRSKHLSGIAQVYESAYRKKNGDPIWFRVSSSPIFREGVFCGAIGLVMDITNERQAEVRQHASDERLRIAFKTSPDAWLIVGREDGKIFEANERVGKWYGYTHEEMIGHATLELGMWAQPDARQQLIEILKTRGRVQNFETLARRKNGETFWVSYSVSEICIDGTRLALEIIQDISETKKAAEDLLASENRFRTLIEKAPVAIGVTRNTKIIYVNQAFRELFHIAKSVDLIGRSILDQWAPESRAMVESFALKRARGERAPVEYEASAIRPDGDVFPVRVAVTTVHLNDGFATVGFLMDQTAVRRAENALRQAEELYRGIFEGATEGIVRTTPDGRVLTVNPTMARILAYKSPNQLLEELTDAKTLFWPTALDRERFIYELEEHNQVKNYVCQLRRRDGSLVWTLTNARRVAAPDGHSIYYEGFISDISEKKQLEEQFLRVQRLESIGMLAAGIAHDLNNVLTPVKMAVQLLRETHTEPTELQLLKTLDASAERGVGLVRQILGFVRGVSGDPQLVHVKYLLQDIIDMITKTFPKSIHVSVSAPNDLWQVMANPTQLHQVVLNRCLNARDAMPQGGSLLLAAENRVLDAAAAAAIDDARPGAWLVIRVEDTGTGISSENLARIWDPFFTTKKMGQGTGLGLSTVRGIVEAHGGFITVTTELEKGTTFQVFIPPTTAASDNHVKANTASQVQGGGETVLFVDDEEAIRSLAQRILVRAGYRVVVAENGARALQVFEENPDTFALVIADVDMPVMDGWTLAKKIRARAPQMKLLMVSGLETQADEGIWKTFANDFLQKPFVASGFVATVKKILLNP